MVSIGNCQLLYVIWNTYTYIDSTVWLDTNFEHMLLLEYLPVDACGYELFMIMQYLVNMMVSQSWQWV